ncbi:MAG: glycosyltransferase family 39 protein [Alistipes sp.]|nr:glycosyltransferase family 39 protein [Alistipes sp.]
MVADIVKRYKALSSDCVVILWLALWWVANLLTAGMSELANDEAYYHIFAQNLAWGYFDHPPMTALLVWLGESLFGGELGVRFFFVLLQPLYLYMFWRVIRPESASRADAELYVMISAAMLVLQLYGLVAVPDGPLLFFTAMFLLTFKRFTAGGRWAWLTMGLSLGLLALSKYHGALVLLFALAANVGWFLRNSRKIASLMLSGVVALAVIVPHLWWQYNHDWVSFAYHLSDRNGNFAISNITDFLVNMLVVFSPFYLPLWVQSFRKVKSSTPIERVLKLYPPAFIIFFTASSFRGYVQPQWAIVAVYGLIWILFAYARNHARTRRYVMRAGWWTLCLIMLVRLVLMFNPIGIKFEVFHNKESYGKIAEVAAGRPVIFDSQYAIASKYIFYTGGEAYSQPNISHRTSQWQYRDDDTRFVGRDVIVEVNPARYSAEEAQRRVKCIKKANGYDMHYVEVADFHPVRKVEIQSDLQLPEEVSRGDKFNFSLTINNPYPYDIEVDGQQYMLQMAWGWRKQQYHFYPLESGFVVPAGGTKVVECNFVVPEELDNQPYKVGFVLHHRDMYTWLNDKGQRTTLK